MSEYKLIFILGIDALECELVDELNLTNLKQLEYGKIIVPINERKGMPFSPEVWASFLVREYISINFVSSSPYTNVITKIVAVFQKISDIFNIDTDKGLVKKIKFIFLKYIVFSSPNRFPRLNRETFLDITKSYKINVPFYNFDNKTFEIGYLFGKGKISLGQMVKGIKLIYESRKKQIFNELDNIKDEDVVFAFMHTLDMLQHCSYLRFSEIEKHYIDLDNYVSVLKRRLEDYFGDVIFIIISDHGFDFDKGNHSMMGFYSSNIHLIPKPEKIIDFYEIILGIVARAHLEV